jgi:hypothetical protein
MLRRMLALALVAASAARAQDPTQSQSSSTLAPSSLAASLEMYVLPGAGQTPETQSSHEAQCYDWAKRNVRVDPLQLEQQAQERIAQLEGSKRQAKQATAGSGAVGAVAGAAGGALIGEIASNDAGEGAAIGAAVGLLAGLARRQSARSQVDAQVSAQQQHVEQVTAAQLDNFKKAFAVCLEAKQYLVRF